MITKCQGIDCPFKLSCKRYTSEPADKWQEWFLEPPIKDGRCDMYWGDQSEFILNQLNDIMNKGLSDIT
jgi:hypothetical protein